MNSDHPSSLHCDYDYKNTAIQYNKIGVGSTCAVTLAGNNGGMVLIGTFLE